jgi:hypothetical protein
MALPVTGGVYKNVFCMNVGCAVRKAPPEKGGAKLHAEAPTSCGTGKDARSRLQRHGDVRNRRINATQRNTCRCSIIVRLRKGSHDFHCCFVDDSSKRETIRVFAPGRHQRCYHSSH